MQLHLVTCLDMPEPDVDEALLVDALRARGVEVDVVAWDDPAVDWSAASVAVLRSTWNYSEDREAFLAWARHAASHSAVRNPLAVVLTNTHKSYLAMLEHAGVPVIPTRWFAAEPHSSAVVAQHVRTVLTSLPWSTSVIKPAVGAGSRGVRKFDCADGQDLDAAVEHIAALRTTDEVLVQPWLPAVDAEGELAIVWIGGEFTHVVRKSPRYVGDEEEVSEARPPNDDEMLVAWQALRAAAGDYLPLLLYARVDVIRDEFGTLRVSEVELVEPSLFLKQWPPALERFADVLAAGVGVGE